MCYSRGDAFFWGAYPGPARKKTNTKLALDLLLMAEKIPVQELYTESPQQRTLELRRTFLLCESNPDFKEQIIPDQTDPS